jgi:LacI family transcriptional regulator
MPEVTLKKLADMLNLSISTVSRALKNHPDISDQTKIKVKELASMLDYEPNTYAINLRTNHSREFGLIVPAISNFFYHSFIGSLEEEVRNYKYSLIILQSGDDPEVESENIRRCKQNRMAGVFASITSQTTNIQNFLKLDDQHIPVIFFDKVPAFEACNKICVADASAAFLAAEALIGKKKKNILSIFGDIHMSITTKRLAAYQDTFRKFEYAGIVDIEFAKSSDEAMNITLQAFLGDNKPDSVFCMSDEILVGVMKTLQLLGLKTPDDVGVIAISDGFMPTVYYPETTYAETSGYKLAKMAFARMMACLAGSSYVQELNIDSILVAGGSL